MHHLARVCPVFQAKSSSRIEYSLIGKFHIPKYKLLYQPLWKIQPYKKGYNYNVCLFLHLNFVTCINLKYLSRHLVVNQFMSYSVYWDDKMCHYAL